MQGENFMSTTEAQRRAALKYSQSKKGIEVRRKRERTKEYKKATKSWRNSKEGKETRTKWRLSEVGKESDKKSYQKRYIEGKIDKEARRRAALKYGQTLKGKEVAKRSQQVRYSKIKENGILKVYMNKELRELTKNNTNPCEVCGDPNVHAHHEDYTKPLEVNWLCPLHHVERHLQLKKEKQCQ